MASRIFGRFWERAGQHGRGGCEAIEPLLSLYVDQMASAAETRRVEAHLAECAACRQALQWMQATHQVIARRPIVAPPADMSLRIAQAIAAAQAGKTAPARPAPRRSLAFRPALAYGFSFALVAAVSGAVFLTGHHEAAHPGQMAHTTQPSFVAPLHPVHPPLTRPIASKPVTRLPVSHVRAVVASPVVAVNPLPPVPAGVKPHHAPSAVVSPETVAVNPEEPSPLPTPIKTHVPAPRLTVPPPHVHSAPAHQPNPLLAVVPRASSDHNMPAKQHVTPQPDGSSKTLIAGLPPAPIVGQHGGSAQPMVSSPVITPQPVHVATASPSGMEAIRASLASMEHAPLTTSAYEAESAVSGLASSGSGTLDITHSDVH